MNVKSQKTGSEDGSWTTDLRYCDLTPGDLVFYSTQREGVVKIAMILGVQLGQFPSSLREYIDILWLIVHDSDYNNRGVHSLRYDATCPIGVGFFNMNILRVERLKKPHKILK